MRSANSASKSSSSEAEISPSSISARASSKRYLCQKAGCDSYGKSTSRDKIEGEVGDLIRSLQPTPGVYALTRALFRKAWDARVSQGTEIILAGKRQIADIDRQIDALLTRVVNPLIRQDLPRNTQILACPTIADVNATARHYEANVRALEQSRDDSHRVMAIQIKNLAHYQRIVIRGESNNG